MALVCIFFTNLLMILEPHAWCLFVSVFFGKSPVQTFPLLFTEMFGFFEFCDVCVLISDISQKSYFPQKWIFIHLVTFKDRSS